MIRGDGFIYFDDPQVTARFELARWRWILWFRRQHGPRQSLALMWLDGEVSYEAIDHHVDHRYRQQVGWPE